MKWLHDDDGSGGEEERDCDGSGHVKFLLQRRQPSVQRLKRPRIIMRHWTSKVAWGIGRQRWRCAAWPTGGDCEFPQALEFPFETSAPRGSRGDLGRRIAKSGAAAGRG